MDRLLQGCSIIVTGATGGIGAETCEVLSQHGASIAINYARSEEKAQELAHRLRANGGRALAVQADVRSAEEVEKMVRLVADEFGTVDGVVNNAIAGRQDGRFDDLSSEDFQNMFDYGCVAVANTVRAVRPIMKAQGSGRIVNIVTEVWNMAPAGWAAYMAGKGAMVGMSRSLAAELGPENITVNMVAPGWMATGDRVDTAGEGSRKFAESLPLRRHGSGHEIGKACVFFLSDLSAYVTGAYLPVTGGRVTQMGA